MNRDRGDPEPPDPAATEPTPPDLPDPLAPDGASAWLWHDLSLPQRTVALSPNPELSHQFDAGVQDLWRAFNAKTAHELASACLGLSEGAPDVRSRAFWQLAAGTFEALALKALPWEEDLQHLVAQVLQQYITYQAQPHGQLVSELLCHELLDACLQARESGGAVVLPLIRQAYAGQPTPVIELSLPGDLLIKPTLLSVEPLDVPDLSEPQSLPEDTKPLDVRPEANRVPTQPVDVAPIVVSQALQWSEELAQELSAWAPKPSRPLKPTVTVLAQVMQELLHTAGLHGLAAPAQALHAALLRSQRLIAVLPRQADELVQAAQQLHQHMQSLAAGSLPVPDEEEWTRLNSWPPALQIQEQIIASELQPDPGPDPEPELPKVKRPTVDASDGTRLWYVQSILERCHKALQLQGSPAQLILQDPGVALQRHDLQQLGKLLDLLLPALRLSLGEQVEPVLHIALLPEHQQLTLDLHWPDRVVPLDDLEMSQAWQLLLSQTGASLHAVGAVWRLSLPVKQLLCTVALLRAGDLKLATPARGLRPGCLFHGRFPPVEVSECMGEQEVILQAPSPLMRRVHGVVGVMPKESGWPVLVYRADLFHFLSTP